ncbi:MAG: hypothetical protein JXB04_11035 [Kiritimatiellae bacterium]|nr:hypothetical protein [Kiritimatiellia bacterium]
MQRARARRPCHGRWRHFAATTLAILLAPSVVLPNPFASDADGLSPTDTVFRAWISGYLDFTQPDPSSGGYAHDDDGLFCAVSNAIVGRPGTFTLDGATRHVLSLGNGGSIVLTFEAPIWNGPGPDFAVFENAFRDASDWTGTSRQGSTSDYTFAELAFVDVATETSHWARFPVECLNTTVVYALSDLSENRFASQDATLLDGVAGKHRIECGTPFDLCGLTNHPDVLAGRVDLNDIRFVRLTDVIGDGSTSDALGRAIFDPYYDHEQGFPNAAPSASTDGFDLRAVGVIHAAGVSVAIANGYPEITWYAATGSTYQIQYMNGTDNEWKDLGPPVAGDRAWHSLADGTGVVRMYRYIETRPGGL